MDAVNNMEKEFEQQLQKELDRLPFIEGKDDGKFNDGRMYGFELGALWAYDYLNKECEHPWASVLGDGEMQPAKCLKCGKVL